MKKTTFLAFITVSLFNSVNAQVLYNETFENYTSGNLGTDPNGVVPGQGGWLTNSLYPITNSTFSIVSETGKGKILDITSPITNQNEWFRIFKTNLNTLIDNRTPGNDVIKFEIDYNTGIKQPDYSGNFTTIKIMEGGDPLHYTTTPLIWLNLSKYDGSLIGGSYNYTNSILIHDGTNFIYSLPFSTWVKFIVYLDYPNRKVYFDIPYLKKVFAGDFLDHKTSNNLIQDFKVTSILFEIGSSKGGNPSNTRNKYDNIKITALKNVPPEVITLSTNQQLAQKFNLYPNPATDVVNITNNEHMIVKEVEIYDTAGKLAGTQTFNDETQIQLNVSALNSGTYLLHLKTDEGIVVKKLVKN